MAIKIRCRQFLSLSLLAALVMGIGAAWTCVGGAAEPDPAATPAAQDRDQPRADDGGVRDQIAAREDQLAELERMMNEARQRNQAERLRALNREADELRGQLRDLRREGRYDPRVELRPDEQMRDRPKDDDRPRGEPRPDDERARQDHENAERMDRQIREMEQRRHELELERAELEASFGRLEMVGRIAEIAQSDQSAAAFAVMHVERFMELPQAVDFLHQMLDQTENEAVRRMIRIRLIELNASLDQGDDVREQLKALILGH